MRPAHLRMARAGLGWTLKELAERAEVNLNTISRYEAGKEVLTGTANRIESVLSAQGVEFLYEDGFRGPGVRLPPDREGAISGKALQHDKSALLKKRSQK